jgi:hypothetical protein
MTLMRELSRRSRSWRTSGWRRLPLIVVGAAIAASILSGCGGTTNSGSSTDTRARSAAGQGNQAPEVALFGDSLAWEAEPYYRKLLEVTGKAALYYDSAGGTAICDYLQTMRDLVAKKDIEAVELAFSGNALTPCMKAYPFGTQAYFDKYRADALAAVDIFKPDGTHVFLIGPPITRDAYEKKDPNANAISTIYADIAAADPAHVTYVDAGAAVEGPDGGYTQTLPCLVVEPCTGPVVNRVPSNIVRSPDGVHFCPDESGDEQGEVNGCKVYSSGAYRYANAMLEALGTPNVPPP